MTNKLRTIFITDIHGCITEMQELIKTVQYDPNTDQLIFLGDLNDRGIDSIGVIRSVREMVKDGALCIKGNHEIRLIKWYAHKSPKVKAPDYYYQVKDEDIAFLNGLPYYVELDYIIGVHAGVKPNLSMSHQSTDDLIYLRYTDEQRRFVSLRQIAKYGKQASGAIFWTKFQPFGFGKDIVYGHHVHSLTDVHIETCSDGTTCYGLDTGCVFGGKLSSLIIDNSTQAKSIVQMQAKETYYTSTFDVR